MPSTLSRSVTLIPHPISDRGAVRALEVHVGELTAGELNLRYVMDADLSRIRIPSQRPSLHTDGLWKHTCFEAFIRDRAGTAYRELNVSPSTEWALYSFDDCRQGMRRVNLPQPPAIRIDQSAQQLRVDVRVALKIAPSSPIALAAVIEDLSGSLSYWALNHPAGKPDFHHVDGFALEL